MAVINATRIGRRVYAAVLHGVTLIAALSVVALMYGWAFVGTPVGLREVAACIGAHYVVAVNVTVTGVLWWARRWF